MGGSSSSINYQSQVADATILQNSSTTCDVSCNNQINSTDIDIINTNLQGGINVTQACSLNAQCLMSNTMSSLADVLFKTSTSTNAQNAASWFSGLFNEDISSNTSYQDIQETISQTINNQCNIVSSNSMSDVNVFAVNSNIGGGINISQLGNINSNCVLNNSMTASAYASGTIDSCATSGKKTKKKCGMGKGANWVQIGISIAVITVVVIIIILILRYFNNRKTPIKSVSVSGASKSSTT